ncbi:MAG: ferrous iron transport protein A [Saprospiraceae bacterium]|nr:ferrous iron transport protein A [Saprospiraceae bacterium]
MVAVLDHKDSGTLRTNESKRISHFTNDQMASKLMSMGILPGSQVEMIRRAPMGGGWYIKVDNKVIAMRTEEFDSIVLQA